MLARRAFATLFRNNSDEVKQGSSGRVGMRVECSELGPEVSCEESFCRCRSTFIASIEIRSSRPGSASRQSMYTALRKSCSEIVTIRIPPQCVDASLDTTDLANRSLRASNPTLTHRGSAQ
jgi:hypothetical protein